MLITYNSTFAAAHRAQIAAPNSSENLVAPRARWLAQQIEVVRSGRAEVADFLHHIAQDQRT
jgi:hypothetical protein